MQPWAVIVQYSMYDDGQGVTMSCDCTDESVVINQGMEPGRAFSLYAADADDGGELPATFSVRITLLSGDGVTTHTYTINFVYAGA